MRDMPVNGWAPVRKLGRDDDVNDWVNLRQAVGLRVVREGGTYLIAADFPSGLVVTDLLSVTSYGDALDHLKKLVKAFRD
ncbi:hypothetical protein AB0I85_26280 [Micromonospora echinofusca]|uniref:hypothetical protein n=1 Tax=Micromonospora TaxID=1873 RepID=UPI002FF2F3ED